MPQDRRSPLFGSHIRRLRRARGLTQEELAERSDLSADTIRRLEHGSFSPSLETLRKICAGLDLKMSTLFESYEVGERELARELVDIISILSPAEREIALQMIRTLRDALFSAYKTREDKIVDNN